MCSSDLIMSALMAKQIIPQVPQSLEELARSSFNVFSVSRVSSSSMSPTPVYEPNIPSWKPGGNNTCRHCADLLNSIRYVNYQNENVTVLENVLAFNQAVRNGTLLQTSQSEGGQFVPLNFALFEGIQFDWIKAYLLDVLPDAKLVAMTGVGNPFVYIEHSSVSGNYLYRLVAPSVAAFVESGIFFHWKVIYQRSLRIRALILGKERSLVDPNRLVYGPVLLESPEPPQQPSKLALNIFGISAKVLAVMTGFSAFIFILEQGINRGQGLVLIHADMRRLHAIFSKLIMKLKRIPTVNMNPRVMTKCAKLLRYRQATK